MRIYHQIVYFVCIFVAVLTLAITNTLTSIWDAQLEKMPRVDLQYYINSVYGWPNFIEHIATNVGGILTYCIVTIIAGLVVVILTSIKLIISRAVFVIALLILLLSSFFTSRVTPSGY